MASAPREVYLERRARSETALRGAERHSSRLARARLLAFATAFGLAVAAIDERVHGLWVLLPLLAFVVLVFVHDRVHRRIDCAQRSIAEHDAGLRRIDGSWPGHGNRRTDLVDDDHPYARDLDLFGTGSLFELLCTARTAAGERTLAGWLLAPATADELDARHAAVLELRERVELREDLALAGAALRAEIDPEQLARWGAAPALLEPVAMRRIAALAWVLPPLATALLWAWWQDLGGWPLGAIAATGLWLLHRHTHTFLAAIDAAVERPARELGVIAEVLDRLEREPFVAPRLVELRARLAHGAASASARIGRLRWLVEWHQARRSQLFGIIAWVLCWGEHFGLAIERWRLAHGRDIERWLAALGELEALGALSGYAFEHPDDPLPQILREPGAVIEGEALGHPLLPSARCVTNDVALGGPRRALMISGSNMSGKSTYLRTVGTDVVLALAGAPVRARSLRLTPVWIGASIRIEDSLRGGSSRFFAEITRLRQITELGTRGLPVLFLLDEVLHGTNSADRRDGAAAVLHGLIDGGAIGMMTTHDLALASAVDQQAPTIENVHFCDELHEGELVFDYRMHPGIVQTSNALALMRAVGLRV